MSRAGGRWSKKEEEDLIASLSEGKTIEEIASLHKRNVGGIEARIKMISDTDLVLNISKDLQIKLIELQITQLEKELNKKKEQLDKIKMIDK